LGGIVVFYLGERFNSLIPILLSIAAANFIYLSVADLIPEIHHRAKKSFAIEYTSSFFMGIFLIAILIKFLG
jgi:zinc and cadmium transporter